MINVREMESEGVFSLIFWNFCHKLTTIAKVIKFATVYIHIIIGRLTYTYQICLSANQYYCNEQTPLGVCGDGKHHGFQRLFAVSMQHPTPY